MGINREFQLKKVIKNTYKAINTEIQISRKPVFYELLNMGSNKVRIYTDVFFPAAIIDALVQGSSWYYLIMIITLYAALKVIFSYLETVSRELLSVYSSRSDNLYQTKITKKKLNLDYPDTETAETLDMQEKAWNGMWECLELSYVVFCDLFGAIISLVVMGAALVMLDLSVLFVVLTVSISTYFIKRQSNKQIYALDAKQAEVARKLDYLDEQLFEVGAGKDIRVYDAKHLITEKHQDITKQKIDLEHEKNSYSFKVEGGVKGLQVIQMIFIYMVAIYKYTLSLISLGTFTVYIGATKEFSNAITAIFDAILEILRINMYYEDYEAYMSIPETFNNKLNPKKIEEKPHIIEFNHVSFKYPNQTHYAVKDVSFKIRAGEAVSIVGENGAGKTTLVYLLLRLYDPTEGEILLDGINIKAYSYSEYIKLFSPVFQDYELLSYTLRENIAYDQELNREKMLQAFKYAEFEEKFMSLEDREETILTTELEDRGVDLSGGEKQRLAIARAYYNDREILILDEPSAALDALKEHQLYQTIFKLSKGKTTVFISHRLSSTVFSDQILVMDGGRLVECGDHEALLKNKGLYVEMVKKQAAFYVS